MAVWGNSFYIYYDDVQGAFIKKISKSSGIIEGIYSVEYGVQDMSIFQDTLYLTYPSPRIQKITLPNFNMGGNISVPFVWEGIVNGIATRSGEIWLSGRFEEELIILNNEGVHIGLLNLTGSFAHLCFMDDKLVIAKETSIFVYDISN